MAKVYVMEDEAFDWKAFMGKNPQRTIYDMRLIVAGMKQIRELREIGIAQGKLGPHSTQLHVDILRTNGKPWPDDMEMSQVCKELDADPEEVLNIVIRLGGNKKITAPMELV